MTSLAAARAPKHADWNERFEIVALVTSAHHCANFILVDQEFVFDLNGVIKTDKSTAALCLGILARIQPALMMAADRASEGLHPVSRGWHSFDCYDTGVDHGGMGKVTVSMRLRDAASGAWVDDAAAA